MRREDAIMVASAAPAMTGQGISVTPGYAFQPPPPSQQQPMPQAPEDPMKRMERELKEVGMVFAILVRLYFVNVVLFVVFILRTALLSFP